MFRMFLINNSILLLSLSLELEQVTRVCSYVVLVGSLLIYIFSYVLKKTLLISDCLAILMFAICIFTSLIQGWRFNDYVSFFVFFSMVTVWRVSNIISFNNSNYKFFFRVYFVQGLLLIILSFTSLAYKSYQEYVAISNQLTLGFSNPNQTGIIIFQTLVILWILGVDKNIRKVWRVIVTLEIIMLSFLLFFTVARTSIFAYLLFVFFCFFGRKKAFKNKLIANAIILFSVVFSYVYIALSKIFINNVIVFGKKLFSGRERVYQDVLSNFTNKWLGNLSYFNFQNSHNAMLTVLVNVGILAFLVYLFFIFISFNKFYENCKTRQQGLCSNAILSIFVIGFAESAVLTGGTMYYIHLLSIMIIANKKLGKKDTKVIEE